MTYRMLEIMNVPLIGAIVLHTDVGYHFVAQIKYVSHNGYTITLHTNNT